MQEVILNRIAEIENELKNLYDELDNLEYTHYGKHSLITKKIGILSEELKSLKNGLKLIE